MNHRLVIMIALLFTPTITTANSPEKRISNAQAHIILDSCFAVASFNLSAQLLQNPLVDGTLKHLEAFGKCYVGELGVARKQHAAGSRLIQDGLKGHKMTLITKSAQLALVYGLKSVGSSYIDTTLSPLNLPPTPILQHQAVHTAASFVSNYLVLDAWRNFAPRGSGYKLVTSTGYLATTLALNYHRGELIDKYLLKTKKRWSTLDKQLTMARNLIPNLVAYSLCR